MNTLWRPKLLLALALAACTADKHAPDGSAFAWPLEQPVTVHEHYASPNKLRGDLTYDVVVRRRAAGFVATLSRFRDATSDGRSVPVRRLAGFGRAEPLLEGLLRRDEPSLALELDATGRFVGTPLVDDTIAGLPAAPTPALAEVRQQAVALVTEPTTRGAVYAHAADLWIPWVELWLELGALPAIGTERVATLFGMKAAVRRLAAPPKSDLARVEAHLERRGTTWSDQFGGGSRFLPSTAVLPRGSEPYYLFDVTAEIEPATLRPHRVTLTIERQLDEGKHEHASITRLDYEFDWPSP